MSVPVSRRGTLGGGLFGPGVSVSDCGYLPGRADHVRVRPAGLGKLIVVLCVAGRGWCEIDGARLDVGPGQVLVIPPDVPHAYGAVPADPWVVWWVHLVGHGLDEVVAGWPAVRDVPDVLRASGLIVEAVGELERDITDASLLLATGAAWHLLAYLAAGPLLPGATASPLEDAREYLRAHATDRVTIAELAVRVNMSPSHFAAAFRTRFGIPVHRYRTELRLAEARRLLDSTRLRIGDIGQRVGYPDPLYFSRLFSRVHGLSPREYRRRSTA